MLDISAKSGAAVAFRLSDVICPDGQQVANQMTPELEVCGRILFLSDCGSHRDHFAVIDVRGILSPLIVPVSRLRPAVPARQQKAGLG